MLPASESKFIQDLKVLNKDSCWQLAAGKKNMDAKAYKWIGAWFCQSPKTRSQ
jgi:hypothetical protein